MRTTLRVLSISCLLLAAAAAALFAWMSQNQLSPTDERGYVFFCVSGLGALLGFGTFIMGVVATTQSRQFRWQIGLIVGAVVVIAIWATADVLTSVIEQNIGNSPVCQGNSLLPQCQPTAAQHILLSVLAVWIYLAIPSLVGLVVLLYSFRMPTPRVPISPTMTPTR